MTYIFFLIIEETKNLINGMAREGIVENASKTYA
jgi:hypothetical protein